MREGKRGQMEAKEGDGSERGRRERRRAKENKRGRRVLEVQDPKATDSMQGCTVGAEAEAVAKGVRSDVVGFHKRARI